MHSCAMMTSSERTEYCETAALVCILADTYSFKEMQETVFQSSLQTYILFSFILAYTVHVVEKKFQNGYSKCRVHSVCGHVL